MPEKKKSTYTGQTEARRKASAKYLMESVEDIRIRVPKGDKAKVQEHAASMGESMNSFVIRAIDETMEHDNQRKTETPNAETLKAMAEVQTMIDNGTGEHFDGSTSDLLDM